MKNNTHILKSDRRAARLLKQKTAPRGGTRAGQAAHTRVRRGYAGLPKALKSRTLSE